MIALFPLTQQTNWNPDCVARTNITNKFFYYYVTSSNTTIDFRPGLVQDSGSGFWLGHWVVRVNSLKKNQNDVVLVKKSQRVATGFLTRFCRVKRIVGSTRLVSWVTLGFFFPCFFFNPVQLQPQIGRLPDRHAEPSFKTMNTSNKIIVF